MSRKPRQARSRNRTRAALDDDDEEDEYLGGSDDIVEDDGTCSLPTTPS